MLASADHTVFEFSAFVSDNIFDALTLKFDCGVEVVADHLIIEEVTDGTVQKLVRTAYFNDIID